MTSAEANTTALAIRGLRFRYAEEGPWTVDVAELLLRPAEQVLLTAPSGAGKSTLLQIVAGLLDPAQGTVEIAGQNVHALRGVQRDLFRGRHVGMVFQTFHLLPGFTALENVMLPMHFAGVQPREQRRRASELLRELGIERANAPCAELSVGQQQRVAVARAIACEPALVLADEPTASLDPAAAAAAMDLVQGTCQRHGAALLCTSHDPALAARFARIEALPAPGRGETRAAAEAHTP